MNNSNAGKTFGQVIREKRQELGISQKELANKIMKENGEPISPQYQNDIEFDRREPPSEAMIRQYAEILKLPTESMVVLAGRVPEYLQKFAASNPDRAQKAFQAFRLKKNRGESQ